MDRDRELCTKAAERWETIGGNRFSFGFTFQHFTFDTVEGFDLDSVPAVFTHDGFQLRGGREDLVTTINSINATVNQYTTFITYGVTDRLDVSLAIPLISNELRGHLGRHDTENRDRRPRNSFLSRTRRHARDSTVVHRIRDRDRPG